MSNIVLSPPSVKQKLFIEDRHRYIAYGGARGGGKSYAVRFKAIMLAQQFKGIKILIMRRTNEELRLNHIDTLTAILQSNAKYNTSKKELAFKNGSKIKFGYCDCENHATRYQGMEFDVVFIDEATQFTESMFTKINSSIRGINNFPKRMYLTCNPGGVGHSWVKRRFITKKYNDSEDASEYSFIQALVTDNTALMATDKSYIKTLDGLSGNLKRAWRYGDWNIENGRYFKTFGDTHIIEPFEIPHHWRRYRVLDYGLDMLACYWVAVDDNNKAYFYKELYESDHIVSSACNRIKSMTAEGELIYQTIAPPDLWNRNRDTGNSTAEIFYKMGVKLTQASNQFAQGCLDMLEWFQLCKGEQGETTSNIFFFTNCVNAIDCLTDIQVDEKMPNVYAKIPHNITHAVDAVRYFCAGRPRATVRQNEQQTVNFESERIRVVGDGLGNMSEIKTF